MSKSQLQSNNTRLASLIDELKGKATGGGSGGAVETCRIVLNGYRIGTVVACYTRYVTSTGVVEPFVREVTIDDIENGDNAIIVLKNTALTIKASSDISSVDSTNEVLCLNGNVVCLSIQQDATVVVS